jgi:hypothetical protein
MAKNLALLALLLGVAALFLPITQSPDGSITVGVLMGTVKKTEGLLFVAPQLFAALFGATLGRGRFARGLGALHLLFGLAGCGLVGIMFTEDRTGVALGMGTYAALASAVLVLLAGLIGLVKPDPKRL